MAKIDVYEAGCRIEGLAVTMYLIMEDMSDEISLLQRSIRKMATAVFSGC